MVRLDRCRLLMNSLDTARKDGYAGRNGEIFRALLQKHQILLTSFPDSFLPLCVQKGLAASSLLSVTGSPGHFLEGSSIYIGDGRKFKEKEDIGSGYLYREDPLPDEDPQLHIPGSKNAPMALRRAKSRTCYYYEKAQKGGGEELTIQHEESCPTVLDLFGESDETRRRAGSPQEEEAASERTDRKLFYYGRDGIRRHRMLEYPLDIEIKYFQRFEQAAVIKEREEIDFVNLDTGMVRETVKIANITGASFSDDGKSVLIRTQADSIIFHRIADRDLRLMPKWTGSGTQNEEALRRYNTGGMSPASTGGGK